MRPSCVVSLLILLLFLAKAQGIRLGKGSLAVKQQEQHGEEKTLLKRSNTDAEEEAILCSKDEQCTGNIKNRKLVTTSTSTTKSLSKNVKNSDDVAHTPVNENTRNVNVVNGEAKEVKVKSWSTSKYRDLPHEEYYADPVDITEMDYSPARRKPPIHN